MIAFISCNGNLVPCLRVYVVQIHVDLSSRFFEFLLEYVLECFEICVSKFSDYDSEADSE